MNRELDVRVSKEVMGHSHLVLRYSTDIGSAWKVVEKLREITKKCVLVEASNHPKEYLCTIGWHHRGQWFKDLQVSASTAPEAICLAALEVVK